MGELDHLYPDERKGAYSSSQLCSAAQTSGLGFAITNFYHYSALN